MTAQQLYLFNAMYSVAFLVVAFFTRATARRILGALAGAIASTALVLCVDAFGEKAGWWHFAMWGASILPLVFLDFVISMVPLYLVAWRIARKFGWRGLAVATLFLTLIGPPRDYGYMARFPEWGAYAPGIVPVVIIALIYATLLPVGYGVMYLAAGNALNDPLAGSASLKKEVIP